MNRIYRRIGHEVAAEGGRSPDAIEEFYSAIDFVCEYKPDERMVFETEMREDSAGVLCMT